MMIGHGVAVVLIGWPANELECLSRSNVLIGVTAPIDAASERFALQLRDPARIRPNAAFRDQGECVGPAPLLVLFQCMMRSGRTHFDHAETRSRSSLANTARQPKTASPGVPRLDAGPSRSTGLGA